MPSFLKILALLFLPSAAFSQTSFNMYLLDRLDPHPYSAGNSIGCWGYVQNGREYGIFAANNGTSFIDVTDSANIHEVDYLTSFYSNWRDFKIYQHYIYIVNDVAGGMQIADLQYLPDSVHLVSTYTFTGFSRAHTIQQSGPYLYLNGGNYLVGGVVVLDITNPTQPVKRGQWEVQYVHDERVLNDTLWACNIYTGKISVINATNKDSLKLITNWTNGSGPMPHNCALTNDRRFLFVTDEILIPAVGRLKVWNIQNIFNPVYVTTWYPAGGDSSNVHNVEIYDSLAVICHYTAGIRVLNISNPANPVEIAWYDTYPQNNGNTWNGCKGIYMMPSGKILANDKQTGFYIVKIGTPIGIEPISNIAASYSLKQNYPNPFNPITNIEFSIPKNSNVTLKIYDISGRETATLINGYIRGGNNRITYDASNLASGIYFYKLTTEDPSADGQVYAETKKMILVK